MYSCCECKGRFEHPKTVTEAHGLKFPPYEKLTVCPLCEAVGTIREVENRNPEGKKC